MDSKSKRGDSAEDRISLLPDEILAHILSYIPTVDSVRTMVLCKRWNKLWTIVPSLDFDLNDYSCADENRYYRDLFLPDLDVFMNFVDGALSRHNSSTVRKFRLHIKDSNEFVEDLSPFHDLIRKAMSPMTSKVRELDLSFSPRIRGSWWSRNVELDLPQEIFSCKTLEILKVSSDCIKYPSTKPGCFPSLKFANITVENSDSSSISNLFRNCPVLEELSIEVTSWGRDVQFNISAPELKTLRAMIHDEEHLISINAPKLQNLVVSGPCLPKYVLQNSKSLVKANIEVQFFDRNLSPELMDRATALLAGVSCVEYLHISGHNYVACSLPMFCNLKQLKVILFGCSYLEYVMELIKRSPKLEDLFLDIDVQSWYNDEYVPGYQPFKPPELVPMCVMSHLKTLSLTHITGHIDQLDLLRYLLKHGCVLKKISLSTCGMLLFKSHHMTEERFQREVLEYQKSSDTCEIEVKFVVKG